MPMRAQAGLLSIIFAACLAGASFADPLKYDTDKDGTLDLAEMEAAAGAAFDRLNNDQDTTLEYKEAKGRLSNKAFVAADPDKDNSLTKDEYIAMAERLFKAADVENDGTLNARELRSKAGRALQRLLK
jgi:Ca2+-binding EF-hand superfamily protein